MSAEYEEGEQNTEKTHLPDGSYAKIPDKPREIPCKRSHLHEVHHETANQR